MRGTDAVQAISAIVTPLLVAALAFCLTRRQDRSNEPFMDRCFRMFRNWGDDPASWR